MQYSNWFVPISYIYSSNYKNKEAIIIANAIKPSGGDLVEIVEARLRITQVTVLQ